MRTPDAKGNAVPFSIEFVKADRKRKTAGELVRMENVIQSGIRPSTKATRHKERLKEIVTGKKNPNHYEHSTINLYNPVTQKITKVHTRLVTKLNEQPVIY